MRKKQRNKKLKVLNNTSLMSNRVRARGLVLEWAEVEQGTITLMQVKQQGITIRMRKEKMCNMDFHLMNR